MTIKVVGDVVEAPLFCKSLTLYWLERQYFDHSMNMTHLFHWNLYYVTRTMATVKAMLIGETSPSVLFIWYLLSIFIIILMNISVTSLQSWWRSKENVVKVLLRITSHPKSGSRYFELYIISLAWIKTDEGNKAVDKTAKAIECFFGIMLLIYVMICFPLMIASANYQSYYYIHYRLLFYLLYFVKLHFFI